MQERQEQRQWWAGPHLGQTAWFCVFLAFFLNATLILGLQVGHGVPWVSLYHFQNVATLNIFLYSAFHCKQLALNMTLEVQGVLKLSALMYIVRLISKKF